MWRFTYSILLIVTLNVAAAPAPSSVDTSAVKKLLSLVSEKESLTSTTIDDNYLAITNAGLALLGPRIQNAKYLESYYASLSASQWQSIAYCEELLSSMAAEFSMLKTQMSDSTGVALDDVSLFGVVGAGNTAATANDSVVVFGLEMICSPTLSKSGLSRHFMDYMSHELTHVVQYRLTSRTDFQFTLLEIAILEGSADYVAESIIGDSYSLDNERMAYGLANKKQLFEQFENGVKSKKYSPWMYSEPKGMPRDMGYWMGYMIAKSYIQNGGTLVELLTLNDATDVFRKAKFTLLD